MQIENINILCADLFVCIFKISRRFWTWSRIKTLSKWRFLLWVKFIIFAFGEGKGQSSYEIWGPIYSPWLGGYSRLWQRVVLPARQATWLAGRYDNSTPELTSVRCFKEIGKVGKVGEVGKVGKVGREGLFMPTWSQLWLSVHCGILAISWQNFLSILAPYLAWRKLIIYMNLNICIQN